MPSSRSIWRPSASAAALLVMVFALVGSGIGAGGAAAALPPCWKCQPLPDAPPPPEPDTQIVKVPVAAATTDAQPDFSYRVPNGVPDILQFFVCSVVPDNQSLWNPDIQFDCPSGPSSIGREIHFPYGGDWGDGQHYVRVMGCQMTWLGGTNCDRSPALVAFRIDRTGPTLAFNAEAPAAGAHLPSRTVTIGWHTSEAGITDYTCTSDSDAPFPGCGWATQLTFDGDGPHTLSVTAKDALGNVGPPVTRTWVVDTVAPVSTLKTVPKALTNDRRPAVTYSADDTDDTLIAGCTLDGPRGTTTPACGRDGWTAAADLPDGSYTFAVRHTDRAGNASAPVRTTFTVDATPPVLDAVSWDEAAGSFTFTADPGADVTCALDGAAAGPCSSPLDGSTLSSGPHELVVRSVDTAGNVSERRIQIVVPAPPDPAPATTPPPAGGGGAPGPGAGAPSPGSPAGAGSPAGPGAPAAPDSPAGAGTPGLAPPQADSGGTSASPPGAAAPAAAGPTLLSERSPGEVVAQAFGLPSSKACLSRRVFVIRLRVPAGVTVRSAKLVVHGKTSRARLRKGRWQAIVDLRRLTRSRVVVRIDVKTSAGTTLTGTRTYGVCGAGRKR